MSFPTIVAVSEGTQTSDSASWTVTYPTGVAIGDLLLFFAGVDGSVTINAHDGDWQHDSFTNAGAVTGSFAKKKAASALSGSFSMGFTAAEQGSWKILCIRNWEGTLGSNFGNSDPNGGSVPGTGTASGSNASPDPNVLDPFNWDAEDTLWVTYAVCDGVVTFSGIPANYTVVGTNLSSGGAGGAGLSVASRERNASSEDPGSFTLSGAEDWVSNVFAVRPSAAVLNTKPAFLSAMGW